MEENDLITRFLEDVKTSLKHSTPKSEVETITLCGIKNMKIRFYVDDPSQYEAFSYDTPNILNAASEYFGDAYDSYVDSIEFTAAVAEIMPDGSVLQHPQASNEIYYSWCKYENRLNTELDMVEPQIIADKATSQEVVENSTDMRDDKTLCEAAREVFHNSTDSKIILCVSLATGLITFGVMVANEYRQNRQYYEEKEKSGLPQIWKATKNVSKKRKTWFMVTGATLVSATCAFAVRMSKRV